MQNEVSDVETMMFAHWASLEARLDPRAVYDIGWFIKNPTEFLVAIQAQILLKELIDDYYQRNDEEDPSPPHTHSYFEAGDGGSDWNERDDLEDDDL